jgi:hypothetical protein
MIGVVDIHQSLLSPSFSSSVYAHVPLREKNTGTKLEALYAAYAAASPPVHAKVLGRNTFAKMLNEVYPNIGPHRNTSNKWCGYFLR